MPTNAPVVIAERSFTARDEPGRVGVRIYQPEPTEDGRWTCRVAFVGFGYTSDPFINEHSADDSAGALLRAIEDVAQHVDRRSSLRIAGSDADTATGRYRSPWHIKQGAYWLPTPPALPGEVIVERALDVADTHGKRTAQVTIFKPEPEGAGHWTCRFRITDLHEPGYVLNRHASGSDSAEALFLAIRSVELEFDGVDGAAWLGDQPWARIVTPS